MINIGNDQYWCISISAKTQYRHSPSFCRICIKTQLNWIVISIMDSPLPDLDTDHFTIPSPGTVYLPLESRSKIQVIEQWHIMQELQSALSETISWVCCGQQLKNGSLECKEITINDRGGGICITCDGTVDCQYGKISISIINFHIFSNIWFPK